MKARCKDSLPPAQVALLLVIGLCSVFGWFGWNLAEESLYDRAKRAKHHLGDAVGTLGSGVTYRGHRVDLLGGRVELEDVVFYSGLRDRVVARRVTLAGISDGRIERVLADGLRSTSGMGDALEIGALDVRGLAFPSRGASSGKQGGSLAYEASAVRAVSLNGAPVLESRTGVDPAALLAGLLSDGEPRDAAVAAVLGAGALASPAGALNAPQ